MRIARSTRLCMVWGTGWGTVWAAVVLAAVVALPAAAAADTLNVGVFVPSSPFPSTSARLEFANRFAAHLATRTGATSGVGRVYVKAADFASAARRGEIALGVVDATYLAASGADYRVLAVAERDGATSAAWQLVIRGSGKSVLGVSDLRGKTIIVPTMGGREDDFVTNVALGGEVARDFFGDIRVAPDALSAVTAVDLGRADAACVPVDIPLPAGVKRLVGLPEVSWPLLVAFEDTDDALIRSAAAAAPSFAGGQVFGGFRPAGTDAYKGLAARFEREQRRGPMVRPALRLDVSGLVQTPSPRIERPDPARYLDLPAQPAADKPGPTQSEPGRPEPGQARPQASQISETAQMSETAQAPPPSQKIRQGQKSQRPRRQKARPSPTRDRP